MGTEPGLGYIIFGFGPGRPGPFVQINWARMGVRELEVCMWIGILLGLKVQTPNGHPGPSSRPRHAGRFPGQNTSRVNSSNKTQFQNFSIRLRKHGPGLPYLQGSLKVHGFDNVTFSSPLAYQIVSPHQEETRRDMNDAVKSERSSVFHFIKSNFE